MWCESVTKDCIAHTQHRSGHRAPQDSHFSVHTRRVAEVRVTRSGMLWITQRVAEVPAFSSEHGKPHYAWEEYFMAILVTGTNFDFCSKKSKLSLSL